MDGNKFLAVARDDAGDVAVEFFFSFGGDEILAAFDGKHDLNVDLCVGVCHASGVL